MKEVTVGSSSGLDCRLWDSVSAVSFTNNMRAWACTVLTWILNDLTRCFELLKGDLALVWKQKDVPVLIPHFVQLIHLFRPSAAVS